MLLIFVFAIFICVIICCIYNHDVVCCFVKGDYSVVDQAAGTIPSELGQLTNWKYVVFGKIVVFVVTY